MKKILSILLSAGILLALTSCGGGAPKNFTVTYETEHGTAPAAITVEENTVLTAEQLKPVEAKGFNFIGWFDGDTEAKADVYTVTKDVTLTAKWAEDVYSKFAGKWEIYDDESPEELITFEFTKDKQIYLNMHTYLTFGEESVVISFAFSGNYSVNNGKLTLSFDKYQTYDAELNLVWCLLSELDPEDPEGREYLDLIADYNVKDVPCSVTDKAIEVTIDGNKCPLNKMKKRNVTETGLCLDEGKLWYMYMEGGEFAMEYELKFNSDSSFLVDSKIKDGDDISEMKGKGTYEVYHNFLFATATEGTKDGVPLPPEALGLLIAYLDTSTGETSFCMEGTPPFEKKQIDFGTFEKIIK